LLLWLPDLLLPELLVLLGRVLALPPDLLPLLMVPEPEVDPPDWVPIVLPEPVPDPPDWVPIVLPEPVPEPEVDPPEPDRADAPVPWPDDVPDVPPCFELLPVDEPD
jgi:hypothetical protein